MKKKAVIAAIAAAGALGALAAYGGYQAGLRQSGAAAPAAGAQARKPLYWHDPMVPGQRFDKPGKSPYMDMQLVPVYASGGDDGADSGTVHISPRVQQNLGVRTALVASAPLQLTVTAVGNVAFNEADVAVVQARASGFVERVLVGTTLQPVRRGQPLVEVTMPDWVAAQEEFLAVRRMPDGSASGLLAAARQRMLLAGMSEQQVRQVESGGRVLARQVLAAPTAGVVTELAAREGMAVAAGTPLYRINGLDKVWVMAELPESAAAQVAPGNPVVARAAALPELELRGKVAAILPEVNAATRTVRARVELANPGGRLAPGMFVSVSFAAPQRAPALLVPSEALVRTGTRSVVMLEQGPGKFAPVQVEVGQEAGGQVEIRAGLQAGQKVAVSGQFLIDSEASLKASGERMEGVGAAVHRGDAVVEAVDGDEVTLSHGPIASIKWPAMTMAFKLPPGGLPAGVKVGARVRFEFVQQGEGEFRVTAIAPAAPAAPAEQHGGHR
ncbi:efflux RND transporter periplasmic adaptor subunit [Pseudoduganella sp. DS3]|uniref:Efflux RND transporter periplasmic adaptor subunit n=1 Tax=Pseudoduganella guangdongensis TaxID=2692179 RepID=A0A6N9HIM7_9BURK|nr:efflux RND transporter periplasmic adaptor subunit [Pseudoduganella guangdongensis]MYN03236.1 efflux RND transporter periplasmic adaptor subunit [Pseudoduganella guangdongensis]